MDELKIKLIEKDLQKPIDIEYPSKRIIIDKSELGNDENERLNYNLLATARKNRFVKDFVVKLANDGFYLIEHKNGVSIFEKFKDSESFGTNIEREELSIFGNLYYSVEKPTVEMKRNRLLVVFSSVADSPINAKIGRRNFFVNFPTISKYIPTNTYVLRISDIGGIVGSFYMNNNFDNTIEKSVQKLFQHVSKEYKISKKDIVLYGVSKGGTAALYHGILGKYKAVAVDPIVSDEYHEKTYNDSHFTIGTFPQKKQDKFADLMRREKIPNDIIIIYSQNSPIFSYINSIIKDNDTEKNITYINVCHSNIKEHPDIGPNTINVLMLVINNLFYELGLLNSKDIDCS